MLTEQTKVKGSSHGVRCLAPWAEHTMHCVFPCRQAKANCKLAKVGLQ